MGILTFENEYVPKKRTYELGPENEIIEWYDSTGSVPPGTRPPGTTTIPQRVTYDDTKSKENYLLDAKTLLLLDYYGIKSSNPDKEEILRLLHTPML